MTQLTANAPQVWRLSLLNLLSAPFRAYGRFCLAVMENDARHKWVQALMRLTDAELASLGLERDDIVLHVYGDYCV